MAFRSREKIDGGLKSSERILRLHLYLLSVYRYAWSIFILLCVEGSEVFLSSGEDFLSWNEFIGLRY